MKRSLESGKYRYVRVAGILLIVMLIAMAGAACDDDYTLDITSTEGGSVTTPAEGSSTYEAGTVVDLVATPDEGHSFIEWIGDTETIASASSASTTIVMNGNYSITATFSEEDGNGGDPIIPEPDPA